MIDRHTFPNGGWEFFQPQTGWSAPTPKSSTFDQTVVQIIKHRMANPAVTAQHRLSVDFESVSTELEVYTNARLGLPPPDALPKSEPLAEEPHKLGAGVVEVARVVAGSPSPLAWLVSGRKPVVNGLATARAGICLQCPKNGDGPFTKWFTEKAAGVIKEAIESRHKLKMETQYDGALGICEACYCPLKLKVHEPLDIALKHLPEGAKKDLWDQCWLLREDNNPVEIE